MPGISRALGEIKLQAESMPSGARNLVWNTYNYEDTTQRTHLTIRIVTKQRIKMYSSMQKKGGNE